MDPTVSMLHLFQRLLDQLGYTLLKFLGILCLYYCFKLKSVLTVTLGYIGSRGGLNIRRLMRRVKSVHLNYWLL